MHVLRNETKSVNTQNSLDDVTCKMDSPIVSSAYNKMPESDNTFNYNQDILHAGITIETHNEKPNGSEKKHADIKDHNGNDVVIKGGKRNVLKLSPENLPCPREVTKTTEASTFFVDPVIPVQNEMKTFRFHEMNSSSEVFEFCNVIVLWSVCFVFFFT